MSKKDLEKTSNHNIINTALCMVQFPSQMLELNILPLCKPFHSNRTCGGNL